MEHAILLTQKAAQSEVVIFPKKLGLLSFRQLPLFDLLLMVFIFIIIGLV